jgi:hypothetical protein
MKTSPNSGNGVSQRRTAYYLLFFGLIWTFCSITFTLPALFSGEWAGALFSLIFVVIGVALLLYALSILYSVRRVGTPQLTPSSTNLAIGESFTTTLSHTFKNNVELTHIAVKLIFRETATYQQGTDTKTVTYDHIHEEYELPSGQYHANQFLQETYDMQIPFDAMHTLNVRRNRLQWFVRIEASIPRLPDVIEEVELIVRPEYAEKAG